MSVQAGPRPARLRLVRLPRTLRGRLVAGLLALLVLAGTAIGLVTISELHRFLVDKLDQQLVETGGRYAMSLETDPHGDTRAQAVGTLGAALRNGRVEADGVVDGDADDAVGGSVRDHPVFDARIKAALATIPVSGAPTTRDLGPLGRYRVLAQRGQDGDTLVSGLPLNQVESTVRRLLLVELLVFAGLFALTAAAGTFWVRLALRPLERVTRTAEQVSALPLASGEVTLRERVPDENPQTEVGRVGVALNLMLGHVEDALAQRQAVEERLREFAADASHELRTPVAAIRGHAELALRSPEPTPESVRHSLRRIEAESQRMGAIVEDLLLLARLDAGRPLAAAEVDLTRVALDSVSDARAVGPDHTWQLELPEEPLLVRGDANRLRQVVTNLLANARVHTPPGTRVVLSLQPVPEGVRLTVTDTGPGIPGHLTAHVFERFVRGDRARSRATGSTGLGLAIVHAVTTAHGGTVSVESEPGRTAFEVRLPV
ncbi:sensor histidine kinase [Streptacidiphilus neutrinimicus]|uniref:sensor histidine kinase n=1 Tax=Streptacidiphilus neutrinimicus TaxID=105420 RepID=UPI000AEB0DA4|nr:HAMP domain-containing sensor histidine kinase [Streptacidiphilus neutrinimicus]